MSYWSGVLPAVTTKFTADDRLDRATLVVAGVVVLGAIMSILDITVVSLALDTFQREFDELNQENRQANVYAQKLSSFFFPAIEFLGVLATVAVLFSGALMIDRGMLEIGTLIAAVGMLQLVFQPLQELSELYGQVQSAAAAMGKISTVLDAEQEVAPNRAPTVSRVRLRGNRRIHDHSDALGNEPVNIRKPMGAEGRARRD